MVVFFYTWEGYPPTCVWWSFFFWRAMHDIDIWGRLILSMFFSVFFLDFVKWGSNPKYVQKTSIRMRLFVGKAAIFCTNWLKRNYRYMYVYIWVLLQFLRGLVLQGIHKPYRLAYNSWAKLFSIILYCCELLIMYLLIVYSSFCWILGSKLK